MKQDGTRDGRYSFLEAIPSGAVHVAVGGYHTMVVKEDGSVRATGCNQFDQLGDGGIEHRHNNFYAGNFEYRCCRQ